MVLLLVLVTWWGGAVEDSAGVGGGGAVEDSAGMDSGEEATDAVKTGTRPKKDLRERKRK